MSGKARNNQAIVGTMAFDEYRMLEHIIQKGISFALEQLVDNAMDSGATEIIIFLDWTTKTIYVIDFGHGLFGWIPADDHTMMGLLTTELRDSGADYSPPREMSKITSCWSLRYMMLFAAYSVKSVPEIYKQLVDLYVSGGGHRGGSTGQRGIGLLASIGACDQVYITSRGAEWLYLYHFDGDDRTYDNVPFYRLVTPTSGHFKNREKPFSIEELSTSLVNPAIYVPEGDEPPRDACIQHGTVVELSGVRHMLSAKRVASFIEGKFAPAITRGIKISVVEKKKVGQPFNTRVLQGRRIPKDKNKTLVTTVGTGRYEATLDIWMATSRNDGPIRFVNSDTELGTVEEAISNGALARVYGDSLYTGYITIRGPKDDMAIWNEDKNYPNFSNPGVLSLFERINGKAEVLVSALDEREHARLHSAAARMEEISLNSLNDVLVRFESMREAVEIPAPKGSTKPRKRRDKGNGTSGESNPNIKILVIDEHGLRVPDDIGVVFELHQVRGTRNPLVRSSPVSGNLNFGSPSEKGKYRVKVTFPSHMRTLSGDTEPFKAGGGVGVFLVYKIFTGLPSRAKGKSGPIRAVQYHALGPESMIVDMSEFLNHGEIVYNIDAPGFQEAFENKDCKNLSSVVAYPVITHLTDALLGLDSITLDEAMRMAHEYREKLEQEFEALFQGGGF